jgi:branched-chain amino acid aminotransferase
LTPVNLASVDGTIGPTADATIPASDEGLLRGDGIFEVMRLYRGRPYALGPHMARLGASAANLRLDVDIEAMHADIEALLAAAGEEDALLRIVATRGGHRLAFVEPLPRHLPAIRLGYVTYAPPRILTGVKSLSYAGNMLATRLAQERGFDEALLVTPHGRVLEAPTSSLFWAKDGELLTPPLDDHILDSITRRAVIDATGAQETPCPRDELEQADEAFLASTIREVQPIAAVEEVTLKTGGPLTQTAARGLRERIEADLSVGRA